MKKFFFFEAAESEGIKFAPDKTRLKEKYTGLHLKIKATQQDANFMPSDRAVPCKQRIFCFKIKKQRNGGIIGEYIIRLILPSRALCA